MAESPARKLEFVVPGRLETLTGGYGYDRRIIAGLRALGWDVTVHELPEGFPHPESAVRREAAALFAALSDAALVIVDGLAFGALPDEAAPHAERLRLVALVHHPLAAETGLDAATAARLADSERRALRSARRVVVTSNATSRRLAPLGVPADRITVVVPGTDPAPQARGSSGDNVHLLCVATLIPRKGYDVLFDALAAVPARNWRLTCVGSLERDPATAARLRAQLTAAGLDDRVSVVGEKSAAALDVEYDRADVFVLPTLYEGYGMVAAEAIARGLPVIASNTGAIGEIVHDDAGIVLPPGDVAALTEALSRAIGDRRVREQLAIGARRRRQALPTWEASSRLMDEALSR